MAMLDERAKALLTQGKNFATIATVMPDGSPQATVVWIDSDGTNIVLNTADGRLKTNNMRRDPRVSICVTDSENPYHQLMVRGRVVELTHEGADDHIDSLAKRYLGQDRYPGHTDQEQRVIVKVAPEHVSFMG